MEKAQEPQTGSQRWPQKLICLDQVHFMSRLLTLHLKAVTGRITYIFILSNVMNFCLWDVTFKVSY